jgi:DNA repair protein RadC
MSYKRLFVEVPMVREESPSFMVNSGKEIYEQFYTDLAGFAQECFVVLTLTQKNKVIGNHVVSLGSLTESLVHPRDVFRHAILDNAAKVAFVHNHPSGDPAPSRADRLLTIRFKECADLMGFVVCDHVIIGNGRYYSFAESGIL